MSECIDSSAFRHITYGLYIVCSIHEGKSLTYAYYHEVLKGRSPKNAPTYEAHVNKEE